jgi:hypothetical protein
MSIRKKANLIIYRFRERGLEVFLLNQSDEWGLPEGDMETVHDREMIELDTDEGQPQGLAMEGDWHEIPSLKAMLYQDAKVLKEKMKEIETGTYVTIKDALERTLGPEQFKYLKELKEILTDRNSVKDI